MITLGTGVGSGIVANGKLIYGHDGLREELGHTIVIPMAVAYRYGKHGPLEIYGLRHGSTADSTGSNGEKQ